MVHLSEELKGFFNWQKNGIEKRKKCNIAAQQGDRGRHNIFISRGYKKRRRSLLERYDIQKSIYIVLSFFFFICNIFLKCIDRSTDL
jgi:hypothetical protein